MSKGIAFIVTSALLCGTCLAQPIPPPKEPVLARAPNRAEWTIAFRFDRDKAKEELLNPDAKKKDKDTKASKESTVVVPKEVSVSKDGKIYLEITTSSNGTKSGKLISNGLEVTDTPRGDVMRIMSPSTFYASNYSDYSRSDFEDVEWIKMGNYTGTRKFNGVDVYGFSVTGARKSLTPREASDRLNSSKTDRDMEIARNYVAYLDVHTQLPVYLDDGEVIRTYSYTLNPSGKLVPPPNLGQALEDWKKEIKRKTAVPPPP